MVIGGGYIAEMQNSGYTLVVRLADLIATERQKRGWSKSELARRARVDPSTVTRLERGEFIGRGDTIARIRSALGIDPSVLDAVLREEQEEREIQYTDLSRVPKKNRAALRRAIEALVREFEREGESD
jgi:transcriptional regulator with XRE-family HTH domain